MIENGLYVDKETDRHTSLQQFTLTSTPVNVLQASAKRVRITFINGGADQAVLRPSPGGGVSSQIVLPTNGGILYLDYHQYGSLIQAAWTAFAAVTGTNLSILDTVEQ